VGGSVAKAQDAKHDAEALTERDMRDWILNGLIALAAILW
jgi:hypothetical protein